MRFWWLAAAVAMGVSSQAGAARYYEFEVHGLAELQGYTAGTFVQPNLLFDSTSTFSFDTQSMSPDGFNASGASYIAHLGLMPSMNHGTIGTINSPSGPEYSLSFALSSIVLGETLQALANSNSGFTYIFRPDGRSSATVRTLPGSVVSVLARTSDIAPGTLGLTERLAITAVPEPATWGMMILGFGILGAALRRARRVPSAQRVAA